MIMPSNEDFGFILANLLARAAKGYFHGKADASAEKQRLAQKKADEERDLINKLGLRNQQIAIETWKKTADPEIARQLHIPDWQQAAQEKLIQQENAQKNNAAGEKKPSIGEATTGLFQAMNTPTGERSVTTQAPVYEGGPRSGFQKVGMEPIGETTYNITPDDKTRMVTQKLAELESIPGVELPKELQDKVLKSVGIEPSKKESTAGQVTERDVFNSLKSTIITDINSLSKQRDEIEKNKGLNQKLGIDQSAQLNEINNLLKLRKRQLVEFTTTGRTKIKNEKDFMQWYHGKIIRTGTDQSTGKKVVKYEDGTIDYAE